MLVPSNPDRNLRAFGPHGWRSSKPSGFSSAHRWTRRSALRYCIATSTRSLWALAALSLCSGRTAWRHISFNFSQVTYFPNWARFGLVLPRVCSICGTCDRRCVGWPVCILQGIKFFFFVKIVPLLPIHARHSLARPGQHQTTVEGPLQRRARARNCVTLATAAGERRCASGLPLSPKVTKSGARST